MTSKSTPNTDFASWTKAQLADWLMSSEAGQELAEIGGTKGMRKAELVELAERMSPATPAPAKKSAAKRTGKRAAKTTDVGEGRFLLSENPDTFTCTVCGETKRSTSFPTVKSGDTELRKSECRICRGLRTGTLELA
jgi:hypothetical protein